MLLAIDTSTDDAGIALYDDGRVLAECAWHSGRRHAEQVLPLIDTLLRQLDATPADLRGLAVALGPGSWSGLRVGLSLAKAIALARQVPLVGVPTLDVLAYPHRHGALPVVPLVRLGRDRYGAAVYRHVDGWRRVGAMRNLALEELPTLTDAGLFCGDVDAAARDLLLQRLGAAAAFAMGADNVRRPAALAELAWQRLRAGAHDDLVALEPIYLGSPVKERGQGDTRHGPGAAGAAG
ncbi:tRNA (adenosine(37)-N6)-threonylcarbamoyltransferase complex dimerization subunit type 1 TsaB [Kallotenue papyrolyticum]|uniref:tRNA (adenosine(37)-N6)-threonylcarbamoyltransferase complex dimerization subunit type 1 TsaB n=1 Tax=Kallotenue papyrolyticum TaxID=1325125 RepID=UPI0004785E44|nr:tRNA (adenosine(37)-N6)-threonylcarbamoyltransferase complex dimerization subunit type 1 TsaB [Kallotenue papyrolyticum]